MNHPTHRENKAQTEAPIVVPAAGIANMISVSPRYVHILAEQGRIPSIRFGKGCVRFNVKDVLTALGIVA